MFSLSLSLRRFLALVGLIVGTVGIGQLIYAVMAYSGIERIGPGDRTFRQSTDVTCGPATLRYVLASKFKHHVSEAEVSALASTTVTGTTLHGLKVAARSLGHQATAWQWNERHLETVPLPAIVHLHKWGHYVVLTKVEKTHIVLFDPLRGDLRLTIASFRYFWDGILLEIQ